MRFSGKINLVVFLQATVVIIVFFLPTFASADTSKKESGTKNECFVVVSTGPFLASGYFYDGKTHRCPKELTRDVTNPKHNPDWATMAQECNAWCEINRPGGPPNPGHRVFPYYLGDACEVAFGDLVSDPSESQLGPMGMGPICIQRFCQRYKCLATYHESGSYESPFPFTLPELFKFYSAMQGFIIAPLSTFNNVLSVLSVTNNLLTSANVLNSALSSFDASAVSKKSNNSLTAQVSNFSDQDVKDLLKRLSEDLSARTELRKFLGSLIGALMPLETELKRVQGIGSSADLAKAQSLLEKAQNAAKRTLDYLTKLTRPSLFQRAFNAVKNTVGGIFGAKSPQVVDVTLQPTSVPKESFTISPGVTRAIEEFTVKPDAIDDLLERLEFILSAEKETEIVVSARIMDAETERPLFEGSSKTLVIPGGKTHIKYIGGPSADDKYDGIIMKLKLFFTPKTAPVQLSVGVPLFTAWPPPPSIRVVRKTGIEYARSGVLGLTDDIIKENACDNARNLMEANGVPNNVMFSNVCTEKAGSIIKYSGDKLEAWCTVTCVFPQ